MLFQIILGALPAFLVLFVIVIQASEWVRRPSYIWKLLPGWMFPYGFSFQRFIQALLGMTEDTIIWGLVWCFGMLGLGLAIHVVEMHFLLLREVLHYPPRDPLADFWVERIQKQAKRFYKIFLWEINE